MKFDKLPKNGKEQVLKGLEKATIEQYVGVRLHGKLEGLWKWRLVPLQMSHGLTNDGGVNVVSKVRLYVDLFNFPARGEEAAGVLLESIEKDWGLRIDQKNSTQFFRSALYCFANSENEWAR